MQSQGTGHWETESEALPAHSDGLCQDPSPLRTVEHVAPLSSYVLMCLGILEWFCETGLRNSQFNWILTREDRPNKE